MGEHKHNPTAQKAKEGLLLPKQKKLSARESERRAYAILEKYLSTKMGIPRDYFGDWPY